ncbi:MAG: NAD(P)-dependent alcohol dehydrogenase [Candidatus Nanopelagicaceae bacterium]|nr:NAD(P)-dependent alcohol dehydrogenase [Candidatus Nanopelagicaceae bacterium]
MKTKGYAALAAGADLVPFEFERRNLGANDVGFEIQFSGICHSDIHQAREEWGTALFPMVPGHEIVGVVTAIGDKVSKFAVGDRIGVGVFIDSCRKCENCSRGLQQYCLEGMTGTYNGYERNSDQIAFGGYSNFFVIDQDFAVKVPSNLDLAAVAPLLCAGITLYSPLRHWGAQPGKKIAVMGLGGLGHMGVKFAAAMGAEVTVLSHSKAKQEDAKRMGASNFVDTKNLDWHKGFQKGFDLILNTVSADIDLEPYLSTLRTDGTLVVIGLPGKPYSVSAGTLLNGRRSIAGSMIGGIPELQEMLDFCGTHNIVSDVEVIKADYINQAYERTVASDVRYRFVIDAKSF